MNVKNVVNMFVSITAKIVGWYIGGFIAIIKVIWRRFKLVAAFTLGGFLIGTSAGIAIGGTAYNGGIAFAVFGGVLGLVLPSVFAKKRRISRESAK